MKIYTLTIDTDATILTSVHPDEQSALTELRSYAVDRWGADEVPASDSDLVDFVADSVVWYLDEHEIEVPQSQHV